MKTLKYILCLIPAVLLMTACEEGIDPVNPLDPGPDTTPPAITITSPADGQSIYELEEFATIRIRGEVRDDIELESVSLSLDGAELITYREFVDYRRLIFDYTYSRVTNGNHVLTVTGKDKSGKTATSTVNFEKDGKYRPAFSGEFFYMPFEDTFADMLSGAEATKVGTPGFTNSGKINMAYAGAANSYLTFPTKDEALGLNLLTNEFSATFWYKFTTVAPDNRAGILSITPPPAGTETSGSRNFGFRFFREGSGTSQTFKLNVGVGGSEVWADGGATASLNPTSTDWAFLAFTISSTTARVYINGQQVATANIAGIDWTGCNTLSIMSGAPNFIEWSHLTDLSLMDELRLYNKALTQQEIQNVMNAE